MRALRAASASVLLLAATGACSVLPGYGGPAPYRLTAYFEAAPSLYEQAKVQVLGLDAGSVEAIRIEGDTVRVDMTIHGEVPLPAGVKAAVVPQNTLGERNVVLYPPWRPAQPRLAAGAVIPLERTDLPVEIDEALEAFTDLTDALDPRKLRDTAGTLADTLEGRGEGVNRALADADHLTRSLAEQDEHLVELAKGLHDIAAGLNRRERQVTKTIDAFAEAGATLADERARVRRFVTGLARLVRRGDVLIEAYQERLPRGVASLAELVLTLKVNSESTVRAVEKAAAFADNLVTAWDRDHHLLKIRLALNPTTRTWLAPLFDTLGLGEVPCLPAGLSNCPWKKGRR